MEFQVRTGSGPASPREQPAWGGGCDGIKRSSERKTVMKEQVVAPRGVRRSASQQKGFEQKPARRDGSARREFNFSPRALFAYVPKALKLVLVILIAITAIVGYRMAASASMFEVKTIDVTGTSRTSPEEIQTLTRRALSKTGVWRADLTALSNELSKLPGVRSAVVTRVLPDG